jgi:O-acetyl-ADP-ribose deacetylase
VANGLKSVSFPSISTGAYGYPVAPAAEIALQTVISFLRQEESLNEVVFVLFDATAYETYRKTLEQLTSGNA